MNEKLVPSLMIEPKAKNMYCLRPLGSAEEAV